ncbi:hypothetical protein SCALM49S_01946 [Streptomyces californicus]
MRSGEGQPVAGGVEHALALLAARSRHPYDIGVGAQRGVRHDREVPGARRLPLKGDLLTAGAVEMINAQSMVTGRQLRGALLGLGTVQSVVIDDGGAVDPQA